jgi:hypothetical protein
MGWRVVVVIIVIIEKVIRSSSTKQNRQVSTLMVEPSFKH